MSFSQSLKGNPKVKSSYPKATHDQQPFAVASNGRAFEGRFTTQWALPKSSAPQQPLKSKSRHWHSANANAAGGTMVPKRAGL